MVPTIILRSGERLERELPGVFASENSSEPGMATNKGAGLRRNVQGRVDAKRLEVARSKAAMDER
jgi:hypothetical protein